ncbi:MAG: hypothetical protein N2202_08155 [Proteobacteria bacterium]|nr:hypothetical protein [Pseudomonadota bacterium]
MKFSAIDLGTNTLRILIVDSDGKALFKKNYYLFLGNEISNGRLGEKGIEKLQNTLLEIKKELNSHNVEKIYSVATAFARKIDSNNDLKRLFEEILGAELNVIDGEEEGKIVLKAISNYFRKKDFMVIDMGGGSTEFSIQRGEDSKIVSLDVGSLNLREMFFKHYPPNSEEKEGLYAYLIRKLKEVDLNIIEGEEVFGVGGTITTIAFLLSGIKNYDSEIINGFVIQREQLERFCHMIEYIPMEELKEIFPLEQGREKVLLSGSLFLLVIMHNFQLKKIIASDYSLLEGIIPYYTK